jgi:hypothetical protein
MRHEIGGRGEARENEGDRPREQTDGEQDAPDQFDQPTRAGQRTDLDVGETRNGGKAENLSGAMLQQFQSREDAENAEDVKGARRPGRGCPKSWSYVRPVELVIYYNYRERGCIT